MEATDHSKGIQTCFAHLDTLQIDRGRKEAGGKTFLEANLGGKPGVRRVKLKMACFPIVNHEGDTIIQ